MGALQLVMQHVFPFRPTGVVQKIVKNRYCVLEEIARTFLAAASESLWNLCSRLILYYLLMKAFS